MLHSQLPWWIGGPLLGLCVVAMRWLMNERLGVMGGWTDVVNTVSQRRLSFGPFGWMLLGLVCSVAAGRDRRPRRGCQAQHRGAPGAISALGAPRPRRTWTSRPHSHDSHALKDVVRPRHANPGVGVDADPSGRPIAPRRAAAR